MTPNRLRDRHGAQSATRRIEALDAEVSSAYHDLAAGNIDRAEQTIRDFLSTHGVHVEGMRVMALIAVRRDVLDVAEELLAQVVRRAADHVVARAEYVAVLNRLQKFADALPHIEMLLSVHPHLREHALLHAHTLAGLNRYREVIAIHESLLGDGRPTTAADRATHYLAIGHAYRGLGDIDEAVASYRRAILAHPPSGDAWWGLANLKTYRFSADDRLSLERALDTTIGRHSQDPARTDSFPESHADAQDLIGLHFAYAKLLEDERRHDQAFGHYRQGNSLKARLAPYPAQVLERIVHESRAIFTPAFFAQRVAFGHADVAPIFIVGLPRSGSTLVEQVLASHPAIDGTMELPFINQLVQSVCSTVRPGHGLTPYPNALATLDAANCALLGRRYIDRIEPFRKGRPFFTDKMGENFLHVGLIKLILPHARIIDVRRDPLACCFSNYKQLFAAGQEFSYDFAGLAHFYTRYLAIMRWWDQALPGTVYRLSYEALVEDLEGEVLTLLAHLGLPFDARCLRFHETEHRARTASSEQVRRPLNDDGVTQWRHFERHLQELRRHLHVEAEIAGVTDLLRM